MFDGRKVSESGRRDELELFGDGRCRSGRVVRDRDLLMLCGKLYVWRYPSARLWLHLIWGHVGWAFLNCYWRFSSS